jgi:hypothetical protein
LAWLAVLAEVDIIISVDSKPASKETMQSLNRNIRDQMHQKHWWIALGSNTRKTTHEKQPIKIF